MPKPEDRKKRQSSVSIERTQLAGALDDAEGLPGHLKMDELTGSLRVNLWTFDLQRLRWVRQPLMDIAGLTKAIEDLTKAIEAMP